MKSLLDADFFGEIEKDNVLIPKKIVESQCEIINKNSNGKIYARISEYDGRFSSYSKSIVGEAALNSFAKLLSDDFDVQSVLGSAGESKTMMYELYLTSPATPRYKYRLMIIAYDVMLYPVSIALDESIALELKLETEFQEINQDGFEIFLGKVWESNKVKQVVKNLIKINDSNEPPFE